MAQKRQEETYDPPERERDGESLYPWISWRMPQTEWDTKELASAWFYLSLIACTVIQSFSSFRMIIERRVTTGRLTPFALVWFESVSLTSWKSKRFMYVNKLQVVLPSISLFSICSLLYFDNLVLNYLNHIRTVYFGSLNVQKIRTCLYYSSYYTMNSQYLISSFNQHDAMERTWKKTPHKKPLMTMHHSCFFRSKALEPLPGGAASATARVDWTGAPPRLRPRPACRRRRTQGRWAVYVLFSTRNGEFALLLVSALALLLQAYLVLANIPMFSITN